MADVYYSMDRIYADIAAGKRLIWQSTFGGLGILFLALLGIVRRASDTIVRRSKQLTLLLHTSRAISASLDLNHILEEVARENMWHIGATFCQIFLREEPGSILVRRVIFPVRDLEWAPGLGETFSLDECFTLHRVLLSKKPMIIRLDKTRETLSPQESRALLASHTNNVVIVPMVSKEQIIGLIVVGESQSWRREPFTQEKMDMCMGMAEQAAVAVENARLFFQLEDSYNATLESLVSALDAREHETQNHSQRVADITTFLDRKMGVDENAIPAIRQGALLHDIGKIEVSDNILLKPRKLRSSEWEEIKKHPEIGYAILKNVRFLSSAKEIVLYHHEHFDGKGYPQGLMVYMISRHNEFTVLRASGISLLGILRPA